MKSYSCMFTTRIISVMKNVYGIPVVDIINLIETLVWTNLMRHT